MSGHGIIATGPGLRSAWSDGNITGVGAIDIAALATLICTSKQDCVDEAVARFRQGRSARFQDMAQEKKGRHGEAVGQISRTDRNVGCAVSEKQRKAQKLGMPGPAWFT